MKTVQVAKMASLEVSLQVAQKVRELSEKSQKSVDEFLLWVFDTYGSVLIENEAVIVDDDIAWTDEELAELLKPKEGLTGKEIVEKHLASGAIGSWSDMGIEDGAEWVNQQKAIRKARRKQKLEW